MDIKYQKCIYCNSTDLSVSDIIPLALTGSKITKKFVCKRHNKETNEKFESIIIEKWDMFRNHLGLKTRDGKPIKYKGDLIIDDIKIKDIKLFDKASLYGKQIFSTINNSGEKIKIGNIDKLNKISGGKAEIIDMSNAEIECNFSLNDLIISSEMKRTVAKIAYEWHCYNNNISGYEERYNKIIDYIINGIEDNDEEIIENVIDRNAYLLCEENCEWGTHSIYEYINDSGCCYVIFNFWNIAIYKIEIAKGWNPNISNVNIIPVSKYNIDGTKGKFNFTMIGKVNIISENSKEALKRMRKIYIKNINLLLTTTTLTIFTVKQMLDDMMNDFILLERDEIELVEFLEYEEWNRIIIIHFILIIEERGNKYDMRKSFNNNLKIILNADEVIKFNEDSKKTIIENILKLNTNKLLVNKIEKGIYEFNRIYENEIKIVGNIN